ncbi:RagB/SusD family nutrient uptake outer membrane protein [Polaribacter sp. L3A8]|uniref:RagB/SusD family nutrient uptake outer membrane protein n=1 Tax=Polaribacter sp. L3A8 TaxID=2686361 RepID=UPI00131B7D72|nr:RagB/SusD family nutrient uptake outer membrane protein [Polaribacter sp. L3A8]
MLYLNKTKIFSVLIVLSIFLYSCNDLKEEVFSFNTQSNAIVDIKGVDLAMNGVYDAWISALGNRLFRWSICSGPSQYTVCRFDPTNRDARYVSYLWDPSDRFFTTRIWTLAYQTIQRANIVIDAIPNADISEAQAENRLAEARFLRANEYFFMVRLFGGVPLHLVPTSEVNSDLLNGNSLPRNSAQEVYDAIIADLEYAQDKLPATRPTNENGRPTSGAVKSLLGEVYLQMAGLKQSNPSLGITGGSYQMAVDKLLEVVNSNVYDLQPTYKDVFDTNNEFNNEIIWAQPNIIGNTFAGNLIPWALRPPNTPGAGSAGVGAFNEWALSLEFYESFEPTDPRRDVTMAYSYEAFNGETITFNQPPFPVFENGITTYDETTGLGFNKWFEGGGNGTNSNENDEVFIRYADVLLMLAEAYVGAGNSTQALPHINRVRSRVGLASLGSVTLENIKQERAWELAGEYQEYFDLQRWGDVEKAMQEGPDAVADYAERYETMPLPSDALQGNGNLVQNAGW